MELAWVQLKHCLKHSTLKQTQLPLHSLAGRPTKTECQPFTRKNRRYINTNTAVPQPEDLKRALQTWISCKISHSQAKKKNKTKHQKSVWWAHVSSINGAKAPHSTMKSPYTNAKNDSKPCFLKRQSILHISTQLYMKKHGKWIHLLCNHLWTSNKQDLKLLSQSRSKTNWSRSEEKEKKK